MMNAPFRLLQMLFMARFALSQQSPSIFVQKFNTSVSYRTNVCERQRLLWNGSLSLSEALKGLNLSVVLTDYQLGTTEDAFFSLKDGKIDESNPGLFAVILDEVARRAGFEWRNSFAAASPLNPKVDGNKTWTDILLWGVTVFDISQEVWGKSVARLSLGISFPAGWYDSSAVLAEHFQQNQVTETVNIWAFLDPFSWSVWVAICVFVVLTGLIYWFLEYLDVDADDSDGVNSPWSNIFLAATSFTGHYAFEPNSHATRLLGFSVTFWALIVIAAYTANLASFLVAPQTTYFRVSTIAEAIEKNAAVCVQAGAVVESLLKARYPELKLVPKITENEVFTALRIKPKDGGCDTAAHQLNSVRMFQRTKDVNYDCTISSGLDVQIVIPAGMATAIDTGRYRCTSLISHVLDYYLSEMLADGFVENAWKDHLNRIATIECVAEPQRGAGASGSDDTFSLSLEDVGGIFVLHAMLSAAAVALAVAQFFLLNREQTRMRTILEVFQLDQLRQRIAHRHGEIADQSPSITASVEVKDGSNGKARFERGVVM
ncbi:ionotropic glutamate receptor [Fragilaria crotonensis]|nr:ionotropic glutamate receptor [Fragilaria crotonensis]